MEIETLALPCILDADRFGDLAHFVQRTAFVICHKSEPVETLLTILRYLPAESPRIIVSNCSIAEFSRLQDELAERLSPRSATYLAHQKDERIAHFFRECGVTQILGDSGAVVDGKGEGMYIGAILAALLGETQWVVYFDADNYAPSALLEYILAMSQLFTAPAQRHPLALADNGETRGATRAPLHAVRVYWASKPTFDGETFTPQPEKAGRCTQVVAPLCDDLLRAWLPENDQRLLTSNAGEQGMTMAAATALRFSSGFSIETFQLLELAFAGVRRSRVRRPGAPTSVRLQQYLSGSPHLHEKKDDAHIRGMIAESLGSFLAFRRHLPPHILARIEELARELGLRLTCPTTYPAVRRLPLARFGDLPTHFLLEAGLEDASA